MTNSKKKPDDTNRVLHMHEFKMTFDKGYRLSIFCDVCQARIDFICVANSFNKSISVVLMSFIRAIAATAKRGDTNERGTFTQ
jgi:hypothetical protein